MKNLDILLENYWIIKENNKKAYYELKDSIIKLKPILSDKLGYQTIITPQLIKLEKVPGKSESWMGIETFEDKMEYSFLCLVLMFLEDKGKEEQFILSKLTEFIEGVFKGDEKIDWTLYRHRRYLIKVLRFVIDMGMIKVDDGDEKNFANEYEAEVLYENTGISKYFARNFVGNMMEYNTLEDFENDEWIDMDKDRGRIRRNRVYRRIIMSPSVYNEGVEDADYAYIKNYRNMIQEDIEKYLESEVHIHKNGAFLVLSDGRNYKRVFPENRAISDIVLQVNRIIVEKLNEGKLIKLENDIITMSKQSFENLIEDAKEKNILGWSKEYREMRFEKLFNNILEYMENFNMIEKDKNSNEIRVMPLVGKIIGKYPKRFVNNSKEGEKHG